MQTEQMYRLLSFTIAYWQALCNAKLKTYGRQYGRHSRKPRKIQKEKIKVLDGQYPQTLILS